MNRLYFVILLLLIVSFHAWGAEVAKDSPPADAHLTLTTATIEPIQNPPAPANPKPATLEKHHGGRYRGFFEASAADLASHTKVIYEGRNNDGKACSLELSFNNFGDVVAGHMRSAEDSVEIQTFKVQSGRGIYYLLPSRAVVESDEDLHFLQHSYTIKPHGKGVELAPQTTEHLAALNASVPNSCKVTFSFRKKGSEIRAMSAHRSCDSEWMSHATQCLQMHRTKETKT